MKLKLRVPLFRILPLLLIGVVGATVPGFAGSVEITVTEGRKPTQDAVVYLVSSTGTPSPPSAPQAIMDQQDKEFVPHVLPVFAGTPVSFPNRDNIKHHVYSFAAAKKFELPLYSGTPASPVLFDKPGIVALGCNIHDWMVGYIYVLPTPYFAKTGADGKARITDVPAGSYEVRVWHPRVRGAVEKLTQRVTLDSSDATQVGFVLSLKREWKLPRGLGKYDPNPGG